MCAPGCIEHVKAVVSRRGLLLAGAAASAAGALPSPVEARPFPRFTRAVDLTHTHSPQFPTFFGTPGITIKPLKEFKRDGFNLNEWTVVEHSGTHLDAPIHFSESGLGPESIPVDQLVVPLVVVDVTARAVDNPDYQVSLTDIRTWERKNGRIAPGSCIAMSAGWDRHVANDRFLGKDAQGVMHFPGFHPETAEMLLKERQAAGLAVDTLSLDHGPSKDFKTHTTWLPAGRWGLECVAGLGGLPARGATLVVGAPKIKGATGGPTRVLALV